MARCLGCGCTDELACPSLCHWLAVDHRAGVGVCSSCPITLLRIQARGPDPLAPPLRPDQCRLGYVTPYGEHGHVGERIDVIKFNTLLAVAERVAPGSFRVRIALGVPAPWFEAAAREVALELDLTTLVTNKIKELGA